MIRAEELRLGNWCVHNDEWNYANHKGFFKWSDDDWYALAECRLSIDNVSPIPITEEILLKCGFTQDIEVTYRWYYGDDIAYDLDDGGFRYHDNWSFPIIKSLHNLQNLYFALTGQELEISLSQQ